MHLMHLISIIWLEGQEDFFSIIWVRHIILKDQETETMPKGML